MSGCDGRAEPMATVLAVEALMLTGLLQCSIQSERAASVTWTKLISQQRKDPTDQSMGPAFILRIVHGAL